MGKVSETLQHITTDLNYVSQEDLNADEDLINFSNGLLRITADNATLVPHSPDILSTKETAYDKLKRMILNDTVSLGTKKAS